MDFDVIIVGGGLVGASFALALRAADLRVAVVDSRLPDTTFDRAGWDARIYAISPGSQIFLRECGAWDRIDPSRMYKTLLFDLEGGAEKLALAVVPSSGTAAPKAIAAACDAKRATLAGAAAVARVATE